MNYLGIVQARMSSRRLPGKVLRPLLGRPMLERQLERLAQVGEMELVVATSDERSDDAIAALCENLGVACSRGALDDVLDRVYRTAEHYDAEHIVRLTADCPLADPEVIRRVIDAHRSGVFDYSSNALERSFPDGLDVEVIAREALGAAWRDARDPYEREHVTPFLYRRPERFRLLSVTRSPDLSAHRWTVDHGDDFFFVESVYRALYPNNPAFGMDEILGLLAREDRATMAVGAADAGRGASGVTL